MAGLPKANKCSILGGWRLRLATRAFDDGNDSANLLCCTDRLRTGSRRLTTDVDHVGTILRERDALLDRMGGLEVVPAIGEAVGSDVQDAH